MTADQTTLRVTVPTGPYAKVRAIKRSKLVNVTKVETEHETMSYRVYVVIGHKKGTP